MTANSTWCWSKSQQIHSIANANKLSSAAKSCPVDPHPPTPPLMPCSLTIVAILLEVLLELVGTEARFLVHSEVSQALCRPLCVCVLHPFWIDEVLPV